MMTSSSRDMFGGGGEEENSIEVRAAKRCSYEILSPAMMVAVGQDVKDDEELLSNVVAAASAAAVSAAADVGP